MGETADALVVFGITGDLARTKTLPALYDLTEQGVLTSPVIGVGRRPLRNDEMHEHARAAIEAAKKDTLDRRILDTFLSRLSYIGGDAMDDELYERLRTALKGSKLPVFYLAIPPATFLESSENLAEAGLLDDARLVVEKPFGTDLVSARELNRRLTALVPEHRLYRIDHFLGKEPVQDIMYLRFQNALFEPVWSREHVDSIQVTMAENFGVEGRGAFYDRVGALRDVVQNHLLQVLALVAMEPPSGFDRDIFLTERVRLLQAIEPLDPKNVVRGQYNGYREKRGVSPHSMVETFVALKLNVETWRWAGVPFYIRAGKQMPVTASEVLVELKQPPRDVFQEPLGIHPNHVIFRIGPDVRISLGARTKLPYERLLTDAMEGDAELFSRQDVIERSWEIVEPVLDDVTPLYFYDQGTWGPFEADTLVAEVGGWHNPPPKRG
jgi:glucose-6-phosphate 1-dehydrogenase